MKNPSTSHFASLKRVAGGLAFCLIGIFLAFHAFARQPGGATSAVQGNQSKPLLSQPKQLSFADRVAYQQAIEEVHWRHRIWPKERTDPKPSLDQVVPQARVEQKVAEYLRNSQALEKYWQPIRPEQLQAEMKRMARRTQQPEVLSELFQALGNDPFLIAECLARPVLSERLVRNFYSFDQRFHGALKERAEADLQNYRGVGQLRQMSGTYSEARWIKSDGDHAEGDHNPKRGIKVDGNEWSANLRQLEGVFGSAIAKIKPGELSRLQEDEDRYYVVVLEQTGEQLKVATIEWRKEPFESWIAKAENQKPARVETPAADYALPTLASTCSDDTWTDTSTTNSPDHRTWHTAVWTGTEMIIWGGYSLAIPYSASLNRGGRYDPSTDSWVATSNQNAPTARYNHSAVWTGTEMIVWGGYDELGTQSVNTGGKYNPDTNNWIATSTDGAPSGRQQHAAVWTGSEMIVWGGSNGNDLNSGGRYSPNTDSWTAMSNPDPPITGKIVWTGTEMIVWAGGSNAGGRYNPINDTWTIINTPDAPDASGTAVWTGSEMIVWGSGSGLRYNPGSNTWAAVSTENAPNAFGGTTVWTGNEMIAWGGSSDSIGGKYHPGTDSWTSISELNEPENRSFHSAVWTGSEMIIWGGYDGGRTMRTGGRYNPETDSWTPTSVTTEPPARYDHTAVWTGSEMIVWGGSNGSVGGVMNTGGKYDLSTDSWSDTDTDNAPSARRGHTAIWTGTEMILWGGSDDSSVLNTGARYNPGADSWTNLGVTNAPSAQSGHRALWTGSEMIVWGGGVNSGRYDPVNNIWTAISTLNEPSGSRAVIWTGTEMIVWGGPDNGARYNPVADTWTPINTSNAPDGATTALWTGSEVIVWGDFFNNTGARYNPVTDNWTATSTVNAPSGRPGCTSVWTGIEMIVWGGSDQYTILNSGAKYNPLTDAWTATSTTDAPAARFGHTAIWTGSEMIVWGGIGNLTPVLNTGGRYCARLPASPTPTPTATPFPTITISGAVSYCPALGANRIPEVTIGLTGDTISSAVTDGSGDYTLSFLASNGTFTVTPAKSGLNPGSAGIDTLDSIAVQAHFLEVAPLPAGCSLAAADVTGDHQVDTWDAIAIQRFYLGKSIGIGNVGKFRFSPESRSYSGPSGNQTGQDYTASVLGDVVPSFVYRPGRPSDVTSNDVGFSPVATLTLPEIAVDSAANNPVAAVKTSSIDATQRLVGFQGDFIFDERLVIFADEPVGKAGITAGNWNISGNVLPGKGPMRTLRVSAYSNDVTPMSGAGTLFELRLSGVRKAARGTHLISAALPSNFIFIDAALHPHKPGEVVSATGIASGDRE